MVPSSMNNFEIQKYYQTQIKWSFIQEIIYPHTGQIKDRLIKLDKYKSIGTYCIVLHVIGDVTCFDTFEGEYTPKET